MSNLQQVKVPATYMRGGTSKGVFFRLQDLPESCQVAGAARDRLFMRVIGSPDPYAKQIDGMGGATSSTSKCVILSKSSQPNHDVDYLYGQVSIDSAFVDWSGNCGNLSTAAGAFAVHAGLVDAERIPENGVCVVRIWQANINKTIIAHVPVTNRQVQELGDFELDGVTFPAAEIVLEFLDPADEGEGEGVDPRGVGTAGSGQAADKGVGDARRHLAWHPVPGPRPDFHRLELFPPIERAAQRLGVFRTG